MSAPQPSVMAWVDDEEESLGGDSHIPRLDCNIKPNLEAAKQFLTDLCGDSPITLQTFSDRKDAKGRDPLARVFHGSVDEHSDALRKRQQEGAGVFVQVNEGDGHGRRSENVVRVRAVFVDLDGTPLDSLLETARKAGCPPSFVVESSPGKYHVYWRVCGCPLDQFSAIQEALAEKFNADPACKDLARVLRLPGFIHQKDQDKPFLVRVILDNHQLLGDYPADELVTKLDLRVSPQDSKRQPDHFADCCNLDSEPNVKRAIAYLESAEPAVEGAGGDHWTFKTACRVRDLGISQDKCLELMEDHWNDKCQPPWGHDELTAKVANAYRYAEKPIGADTPEAVFGEVEPGSERSSEWPYARKLFGRTDYPWHVLPDFLAENFKQMGRAFATSAESLPGVGFAIVASLLGSTVSVSAKESWNEPLIFWFGDIRVSGSGKTPAARALCKILYDAQDKANAAYDKTKKEWLSKPDKDRGPEPPRPRGFFTTGLTLEGARVDASGHGGTVAILDELSALISMQNEYKSGGSDREAWLCLYDGHPARIVRASEARTIKNCRLSVFGGIQPSVWQKTFQRYTEDGMVFRMLLTYGGEAFYPQTSEVWSSDNRQRWETLLVAIMEWADRQEGTQYLRLSDEARDYFNEWCNELASHVPSLPRILRGFIPKAKGYALKLAGVIFCIRRFESCLGQPLAEFDEDDWPVEDPFDPMENPTLSVEDIERGIIAVTYYLGQAVDAACALIMPKKVKVITLTPQVEHLAKALDGLRGEVDKGLLAIGVIQERYNGILGAGEPPISPRTIGSMLRHAGLTIPEQRLRANGRSGVYCLRWDSLTEEFILKSTKSTCPRSL